MHFPTESKVWTYVTTSSSYFVTTPFCIVTNTVDVVCLLSLPHNLLPHWLQVKVGERQVETSRKEVEVCRVSGREVEKCVG